MKGLAIVLFATAAVCAGAEWNSFQATYGKTNGYFDLPWTLSEATSKGWQKAGEDRSINAIVLTQKNDPHTMLLMDKNGNIAGMRMAIIKKNMDKKAKEGGYAFTPDYENNPYFKKATINGEQLWYSQVLFVSPTTLASGGRRPLNKAKDNVADGIFFNNNGKWTEVVRDECKYDKTLFNQANCFPGMGDHYVLKNANEEDCDHRRSFIALYDQGRLSGFVFSAFGDFVRNPGTQSYYEDFPASAIKVIMPNAPACMEEYVKKFGLNNMHVYFTKNASKLTCPNPRWSTKC